MHRSFPIASIIIERDRRIRREVKAEIIADIAESISRIGLINPITIDHNGVLIAGETRLRAAISLGWTAIDVNFREDLSETDALSIELEENVKRRDLDWKDQCDALLRFHNLQKQLHPEGWTQEQTAAEIGLAKSTVASQLKVAREIATGNERVLASKEYSTALNITVRMEQRKAADELALIHGSRGQGLRPEIPILNVDFLEWVESYYGPPFNLISCDFPYGIDADKFNQGSAETRGGYEDSEDTYWRLVAGLTDNKERLCGDSCHILFWFSMRHYTKTLEALSQHFWVDPYPLVWFKSCNTGTLPDPSRGPRRVYEVAFLCSHGDRKIIQAVSNVFPAPVVRSADHMSEKSQIMQEHFFRMFVDGNTRLLDPTCGSGSSLRAADRLGAESVLGLERDPEFARLAGEAWERRNV